MDIIKRFIFGSPEKKFTYLQPKLKTTSVILVIFIIFITFWIVLRYVYIYSNWNNVKCKDGIFYVAPLFGKDSTKTINECMKEAEESAINKSLTPINEKINDINTNIDKLDMKIEKSKSNASNMGSSINSSLFDATSGIQQNILYVKNALAKILGAIILSTNMNNGTITSTQALKDSSLSKIIKAFNDVVAPANAKPEDIENQ
jgi:hypothetical protein